MPNRSINTPEGCREMKSELVERARFLVACQDDPDSVSITELCDEFERLRELLNKTSANNRMKARELRRAKHT